jgi:DNA invertase Pin-like site-specific DNA recombinase
MTTGDQQGTLENKFRGTGFKYIFSEDCSTSINNIKTENTLLPPKRATFEMVLTNLKKGDVVVIWSWMNLIDFDRKTWATFDVLARVALIHQLGASVMFVNENIETRTAAGRLTLSSLISAEQYNFDRIEEGVTSQQNSNVKPIQVHGC